jgi:predicted GNAT family N-acyltransferase
MKTLIVINKGRESFDDAAKLREEVFILEQGFIDEFDDIDDIAWHVTLYLDDECIGVGRVFALELQPDEFHIGRLAIKKPYRNKGYGRVIMNELEKIAIANMATRIVLSAQVQALDFYRSCGYKAEGDVYLDQHEPHQKMVRLPD